MKDMLVLVVAATIAATSIHSVPQGRTPSDSDWDWLAQHRLAAFDNLMPIGRTDTVAYRRYRDLYHDESERYFSISLKDVSDFGRDPVEATVVLPLGPSIQQQMLQLHMKDPSATLQSVLSRVNVRRLVTTSSRCRAIGDQFRSLPAAGI